jgi:hypothetical protein
MKLLKFIKFTIVSSRPIWSILLGHPTNKEGFSLSKARLKTFLGLTRPIPNSIFIKWDSICIRPPEFLILERWPHLAFT